MLGLGLPELAVLVFGPKRLLEIDRSIGKTFKAAKEFETELKKEPADGDDQPPPETCKVVSNGKEKKEIETSDAKGSM